MEKLINDFSFGLFFWQAIILLVLIFLMVKFAWKPIMESISAREDGIRDAIASAETAKKEMMNLKADNQRLLDEARAERDTMLKEAREIKEKMIADAKSEAQVQGAKMIEQAKATIESEKNAALAELKNQVSGLSVQIAEKLLKGELSDKSSQTALVERMLEEVKLN
ncbi:ATP synthase subunit B [Flavobacterium enshiense DK69]|uniref:ATP synthase subunit b n=1 Tax=Flavobacterium enshiense DK69 TaxID=1107311 RepID=V6SD92_9FLAO|nr:F0F1 ATP synthase subunit B [Flavobacterium enshiense]ESU24207.1 ATP synthase subunit B [Flavobacterium enshiense DK69]KGO95416.1 ATP F0F1 synthase subunit B [Flavobacterium enshiense DK69]